MAKFFVGQRVRIVSAPRIPEMLGKQATIVSELHVSRSVRTGEEYAVHALNIDGVGTTGSYGLPYKAAPSQLEPITDRNEVVTWESCAWSPHGVSA